MKSLVYIFCIFFFFFLFLACGERMPLQNMLRQMAIDNVLDGQEIETLRQKYALSCAQLRDTVAKIYPSNSLPELDLTACQDWTKAGHFPPRSSLPIAVNFYVENSASMHGYFESNSRFRAAILALSAFFKTQNYTLQPHFINESIYNIQTDFINALSLEEAKKYGNLSFSELDKILSNILQKLKKEPEQLAVFVSDLIYDNREINAAKEYLNIQYKMRDIFWERGYGKDNSILVLRLRSEFTGTYYDYKKGKTKLKNAPRPYYIWIMGKAKEIDFLHEKIPYQDLVGFEEKYLFRHQVKRKTSYFSILPSTQRQGSFRRQPSRKYTKTVNEISQIKLDKNTQQMCFILSINFAELPFPKKYLLDKNNFQLEGNVAAYIDKIEDLELKNIHPNDKRFVAEATHLVYIVLQEKITKKTALNLNLLQTYPDWKSYATADDTAIKTVLDKTFGLDAIMQGVQSAFNAENNIFASWDLVLHPRG